MLNKDIMIAVLKKDLKQTLSNLQIMLPLVIVPLLFVIILPLVFILVGEMVDLELNPSNKKFLEHLIAGIPPGPVKEELKTFTTLNQQVVYIVLNYLFIPLFLLLPLMVSSIIAASSFAGEKEHKTLETLLYSPIKETELFLAKLLSAFIPSLLLSLTGFVIYGLIIDTVGLDLFKKPVFPSPNWILVILWLIPSSSLLAIGICVLISAKVRGFQEAYQLSGLLVLPFLLLLMGQATGLILLDSLIIFLLGIVLFVVDFVMLRQAALSFNRENLFRTQIF